MNATGHPNQRNQRDHQARALMPAMHKGWRRRCPNCGKGALLKGYLKVRDTCPVCEEELHRHHDGNSPFLLTALIVGLIMGPAISLIHLTFLPDPLVTASIFLVGSVALSLYLLPRLKGLMVAFQWAKRRHGFGAGRTGR